MKILFWNAQGLAQHDSRAMLKNLCHVSNPDFLFLSEPWIDINRFPSRFWRSLNLKVIDVNNRGLLLPNLWFVCSTHLNPRIISVSFQFIACSIAVHDTKIFVTAVYAHCNHVNRSVLWEEFTQLAHGVSWVILTLF